MELVNKVTLAKLAWRFLKEPTAKWTKVLATADGQLGDMANSGKPANYSFTRKGLIYGYGVLEQGLRRGADGGIQCDPWWTPSAKGQFTSKSAYDLITTAPNHETMQFDWREL